MRSPVILCLLAGLSFFTTAMAQSDGSNTDSVGNIYKTFIQQAGKEKVVLQTDRKIYLAGEKIWFKAFALNTASNRLSLSTNNLFTDLVDDQDSVIAKLVLNNHELRTGGAFILPDSIRSGFYWIRAYTAKILATDTNNIFIQPIYVLNKNLRDASVYNGQYARAANKGKNLLPGIHFYPERLTAIPGIISTGVLQVTDADNNPYQLTGSLVDNHDSVITTFATNQFGLSRITFVNDPLQKYRAVIRVNGHDIKYQLPVVNQKAAQISFAKQSPSGIKAFVTLEEALPADFRTTIIALHGDSLCYAAVGSGIYGINIPLTNFPGGITSFLLFDQQHRLLAERKIYIDKQNFQLDITSGQSNYAARESVNLNINISEAGGVPLPASFNVAVQDAWLDQLQDSIDIHQLPPANDYMISAWLERFHDRFAATDIDLIMMTLPPVFSNHETGVAKNIQLSADDNEKLLNLVGRVSNGRDKAVKQRVVTAISKNKVAYFLDTDSANASGIFKIPLPQNVDSLSVFLQVTDKFGIVRTDDSITLQQFQFPVLATPGSLKQQFLSANISMVASLRKYHIDTAITFQGKGWLKPVAVTAVVKSQPNYDVTKRINSISQILTSDKLKYGYNSIGYALLTVPGVTMYAGDLSIFGSGNMNLNTAGRPLLVVDGVAMGEASLGYFNSLSPSEVDFIEVLRGAEAGIYGMRGANGVISVNTRNGQHFIPDTKNYLRTLMPVTYHVNPQFEMPHYEIAEIKASKLPDPRTTIYWNTNTITDSTGSAAINFYTADNPTNYSVTVTGITAKGDLIYKTITISRK